jgi:hypothetical protein
MRFKQDIYERLCNLEDFVYNLDLIQDEHEKRLKKLEKK